MVKRSGLGLFIDQVRLIFPFDIFRVQDIAFYTITSYLTYTNYERLGEDLDFVLWLFLFDTGDPSFLYFLEER